MNIINKSGTIIERMSHKNINELINLSALVGWDYDEHEIQTILSSGIILGYRNNDDKLIACAAIITYDLGKLASIGMVIVNPAYQGLGLGRKITQACLDTLEEDMPVMLIATEQGKGLYNKMGFKEIAHILKYTCEDFNPLQSNLKVSNSKVRLYKDQDFSSLVSLDEQAFGDCRNTFLFHRIRQSKKALVITDGGCITGYALSIETPQNLIIGPVVSFCTNDALLLLKEMLNGYKGNIRIDMPKYDKSIEEFLMSVGFKISAKPSTMIINSEKMVERNDRLYALAAQIFG